MSTLQLLPTREMPSSMTVAELINAKREMLELMERKHRDIVEHRLRYYSPYPKQIEFHAAGLTFRERLLMAANQSGKTWSAGAEVAMHLTGQYPTNWPGRYMRAANRWMAGSESAELTKKGLQRILLGNPEVESEWGTGMIPKDCILDVSRRAGVADAVASIVVKHQCGDPSTLQLNSYDQGRMQHVDSSVLTPTGWRRIGDLTVGDYVIAVDGTPTRVAGVFRHGVKQLYRFTFDSGVSTLAGAEHLWEIKLRTSGSDRVVTTEALIKRYGDQGATPPANHRVSMPHVETVQFASQSVPLDPYLVGALLGDGCLRGNRARFTSADPELAEDVARGAARVGASLVHWGGIQYGFTNASRLMSELRKLGLDGKMAHDKHVPEAYLWNEPAVRWAVLQGLMDTDGTVSKKGCLSFASTSKQLAEDVAFLVRSFGGKARIRTVDQGRKRALHVLACRLPNSAGLPFRLARKAAKCVRSDAETNRHILRSIERVEPGQAVCIAVEHPRELYVTDDFIVTHNTKWQADTVDGVWFDEEPPMELYTEGLTRTNTTQGPVMMTFTPLLGQSAVVLRFRRERPAGTHVTNMTIDDALHYSAEDRAAIIASYPEHEREARTRGIPIMGSGRVFPIAEAGISVESFHIPAHWPRIVGLDFGWDHPAAAVWMAWDRDTDTVYVYDVWRAREQSVAMQSLVLRARGDWIPVAWPHDGLQHDKGSGEQLAKQYKTAGVAMLRERAQFEDGTNGVEAGIQEMLKRMQTRQLRVFKHLEDWFEEFRDYHRKDGLIVKERDDLMAATRYGLMELRHALTEYEARGSMAQALGVFGPATAFGVLDPTMGY